MNGSFDVVASSQFKHETMTVAARDLKKGELFLRVPWMQRISFVVTSDQEAKEHMRDADLVQDKGGGKTTMSTLPPDVTFTQEESDALGGGT